MDCTALADCDDVVQSLGVSDMELFCRRNFCTFTPVEDFNFPDTSWECHSAKVSRSWKFLIFLEDNFLSQTLGETAHKDTLLGLLLVDSRGLLWDVVICGCLGHSNLEIAECKIFTVMRKIFGEMRKKELLPWTAEEQISGYTGSFSNGVHPESASEGLGNTQMQVRL